MRNIKISFGIVTKVALVIFAIVTSISLLNIGFAQSGKSRSDQTQTSNLPDVPKAPIGRPLLPPPPPEPVPNLLNPRVAEQLNLSDEQRGQIKAIDEKTSTEARPYHEQLRTIGDQMREAMESDVFDEVRVRAILVKESELRIELKIIYLRSTSNLLGLLTPEQKAKFHELQKEFAARVPRG
jgi:hypothetical protein